MHANSHDPSDTPEYVAAQFDPPIAVPEETVAIVAEWTRDELRTILGLRIRDMTGGFRCFRRAVLETVDLGAIGTKGYAFQIELTYRALRQGFTVAEVPIVFTDRMAGQSKMTRAIFLEAVRKVPELRLAALTGKL